MKIPLPPPPAGARYRITTILFTDEKTYFQDHWAKIQSRMLGNSSKGSSVYFLSWRTNLCMANQFLVRMNYGRNGSLLFCVCQSNCEMVTQGNLAEQHSLMPACVVYVSGCTLCAGVMYARADIFTCWVRLWARHVRVPYIRDKFACAVCVWKWMRVLYKT